MTSKVDQALLQRLNGQKRDIVFSLASDEVVSGFESKPGNFGKNVSVSQVGTFSPRKKRLLTGETIGARHEEKHSRGRLRCYEEEGTLCVAVFSKGGKRLTRALVARAEPPFPQEGVDVGLFAWFGPVEYIGTPWSDNDPDQCQVITVDRLRSFPSK